MNFKFRGKYKLDKLTIALFVDEGVRINTKALHHTIRTWNGPLELSPHEHLCAFGVHKPKIPEVVVGCLSLRNLERGKFACRMEPKETK